MSAGRIPVTILEKTALAPRITRFVLGHARGERMPPHEPGAHITVTAPNGLARSYSLTDRRGDRYAIAVQRAEAGRGGSMSLVDETEIGHTLEITPPANAFPLVAADDYLLIAGGIGITPLRAMREALLARRDAARVRLVYLARTWADAAFADELAEADDCVLHLSGEAGRLDLWPFLENPGRTQLYCCGSDALMEEVRRLTMHWGARSVHFERFLPADGPAGEVPFTLEWEPTGERIAVGATETILDALRARGIPTESSCQSGTCGTCVLRLVAGEADHRDLWLEEHARATRITPCVSRALSDVLRVGPVQ